MGRQFTLKHLFSIAAMAGIVAVPTNARADDPLARIVNGATFDRFVARTLREYGVPGAVVAIASPNGTVFVKGYGVRKAGEPELVDGDTRFGSERLSGHLTQYSGERFCFGLTIRTCSPVFSPLLSTTVARSAA